MADKKRKVTRTPLTKDKNNDIAFKVNSDLANKMMDKAFKDGKPRSGTSAAERLSLKAFAWSKYEKATTALKSERRSKDAGKRLAKAQAYSKSKQKPK